MKLFFDKTDSRKLELWAISHGLGIDELEGIAILIMEHVNSELEKLRPETKGITDGNRLVANEPKGH